MSSPVKEIRKWLTREVSFTSVIEFQTFLAKLFGIASTKTLGSNAMLQPFRSTTKSPGSLVNIVVTTPLQFDPLIQARQRNTFEKQTDNFADVDFDYIEDAKGFSLTQKGNPQLVDQRDKIYQKNRYSSVPGKIFWRCKYWKTQRCLAACITLHNKITRLSGEHTCKIPPAKY